MIDLEKFFTSAHIATALLIIALVLVVTVLPKSLKK